MVKAQDRQWEFTRVEPGDSDSVVGLIEGGRWLHHHLDWAPQATLLTQQPFLLASDEGIPVACMAAPLEQDAVAWIRLLAIASGYDLKSAWEQLWGQMRGLARESGVRTLAALGLNRWLPNLLEESGFRQVDRVIHLELDLIQSEIGDQTRYPVATIEEDDLPQVAKVDNEAFAPIWRHSLSVLQQALEQSEYASLIRLDERAVAYQMSTVSSHGGHLARLAVIPDSQGKGLAQSLVRDAARYFRLHGQPRFTVNTQLSNQRSQHLYQRLGFKRTGQSFPVHQIQLA